MKLAVVDTSIAIKWFVDEPGKKTEQALAILENIKGTPEAFIVPELFFNEMLAVLCRLLDEHQQIQSYMQILAELGLERVGNGRQLINEAAKLAKRYNLSGYDAVFVSSAKLVSGHWLTADEVAAGRLAGTGLVKLL